MDKSLRVERAPPMRPLRIEDDVVLVFPFYRWIENGERIWITYRGRARFSKGSIELKALGISRAPTEIETPGAIAAIKLSKLYKFVKNICNSKQDCVPALFTCRNTMRRPLPGFLSGIIFMSEPNANSIICAIVGEARIADGSCQKSRNKKDKNIFKGSKLNIAILLVAPHNWKSQDYRKFAENLRITNNSFNIYINFDLINSQRLHAKAYRLACLPVYPANVARGNGFYPLLITAMLRSSHVSPSPGGILDILEGSLLVGKKLIPLAGPEYTMAANSWIVPSPVLLSGDIRLQTKTGVARLPWHEDALTRATRRAPIFSYQIPDEQTNILTLAVFISIINSIFEMERQEILKAPTRNLYLMNYKKIINIIDNVLESDLRHVFSKRFLNGLNQLKKLLLSNKVQLGFTMSYNEDITRFVKNHSEPKLVTEAAKHVDPKLIAKALLNGLVTYPIVVSITGTEIKDSVPLHRLISNVVYNHVALLEYPLPQLITSPHIAPLEVFYMHASIRFNPPRALASLFLAILQALEINPKNRSNILDIEMLLIAWLLLLSAALAERGLLAENNRLLVDANAIAKLAGDFALLAGVHGLTHVAVEAIADDLGVSRPDLYMSELALVPLRTPGERMSKYTLRVPYQEMKSKEGYIWHGLRGILINGAIFLGPGISNPEILVAVKENGMYQSVEGRDSLGGFRGLCEEFKNRILLRPSHGDKPLDICELAWRSSKRSLHTALAAVPKTLRNIASSILGPFWAPLENDENNKNSKDKDNKGIHQYYYPQHEVTLYILERIVTEIIKNKSRKDIIGRLEVSDVKAYVAQLTREGIPHCYDGCEMCVMSDECPMRPSLVQQLLVSKSAARILCMEE